MSQTAAPNVAFIFDCDGTLVNSTPVWAYAQPELLHRHGVDVTVDDFAQFEHLSLEDECQAYHDTWGIGANGEELYRELSDILIDGYSKVPLREGLLAFLKQAQEAGISMCVATSTPAELVRSALAGAGLDAYMEFVTTTGEAGRSKQFPMCMSWHCAAWRSAMGISLTAHGCLRTPSLALRALAPPALSAWASMTRTAVWSAMRYVTTATSLSTVMRTWSWPAYFRLRARRVPWLAKY